MQVKGGRSFVPRGSEQSAVNPLQEIERRRQAAQLYTPKGATETETQPLQAGGDDPLLINGQQFALLHIAHRQLRPRSLRPAFRLLGIFPTRKARDVWAGSLHEMHDPRKGCSLHAVEVRKFFLIPTTEEKQSDANYILAKVQALKDAHLGRLASHKAEFRHNVDAKSTGEVGRSEEKKAREAGAARLSVLRREETDAAKPDGAEEPAPLPRGAEVRFQNYAVVGVLRDMSPDVLEGSADPEPAVQIFGAFDKEDEAKAWIQETASKYVRDLSLDVVCMYEWLYPEDLDPDQIEECFRENELDLLMREKKNQKNSLVEYEEWCRSEGIAPEPIEVSKTSPDALVGPLPEPIRVEPSGEASSGEASSGEASSAEASSADASSGDQSGDASSAKPPALVSDHA